MNLLKMEAQNYTLIISDEFRVEEEIYVTSVSTLDSSSEQKLVLSEVLKADFSFMY